MSDGYNGWTNYETWNVALWLENTEDLYAQMVTFMSRYNGDNPYEDFIKEAGLVNTETGDEVSYSHPDLDIEALDEMLNELNYVDDWSHDPEMV